MKKLFAFALVLWATSALAATTPNSFVTPQTPTRGVVRFLQGTDPAGTAKTIYTAGANGSRCYGLFMSNSDGSATHTVSSLLTNSTFTVFGASVTTTVGAGTSPTNPPQPFMTPAIWPGLPVDEYGNPYIQLASGDTLQAQFATALTAGTQITMQVTCSDF